MAEIGEHIDGRYTVLSRVGGGGMADVYLAEDQQLGRQVALKFLHRRFAEDQEFVERFRREASSAAGLSHPNVVSVFDRGEWDGTYYIAMEYLPGRSLKTVVREEGALDPARAIEIVIQILRAARFAHQHGVIHRDLKPHNVIVDDEGRVRVTDFGIARAGASDMTETGSIMGTAQYLSPEQAQGHAVSAASDIYAVGIVLYELLTGRLPFDGETAVTIALKQVTEQPQPPSALSPAVGPALDAIVLRALAKAPEQRFADAAQFIAALEQAREAQARTAAGATAHFQAPLVIPEAGPGALAVAAAPAALVVPPAAPDPGLPPPDATADRRWWWLAAALLALIAAAVVALLLAGSPSRVTVPGLARCSTPAAAGAALQRRGLHVHTSPQPSGACPAGRVVSESPTGGTRVARGSTVTLVLSSGPATVAVPRVTGERLSRARATLRAAGLVAAVQTTYSAGVPSGRVISTVPGAGSQVPRGGQVVVNVSSGPQPVSVPDVTHGSLSAARARLAASGLSVGHVTQRSVGNQSPGTVLSQSPGGGASAPAGSSVDLTVASAPVDVTIPSVVGQSVAQAAATLGAAGFRVVTSPKRVPVQDQAKDGTVVKQQPGGGGHAKHGATVTLTVGSFRPNSSTTSSTTTSSTSSAAGLTTTTTSTAPA